MKQVAMIAVLGAAMVVGCDSMKGETKTKTASTGENKAITNSAAKIDTAKAKPMYFEMRKDGQMYVFDDVKTMTAFRDGGKSPKKPTTEYIQGHPVNFVATAGDHAALVKEYEKQHK